MAQASSVQREPSMEEILASIRRIIEDNDTGRRPSVDFEQERPEPEDDRGDRNVIEVEAFRAELQAAKPTSVEVKPVEAAPTPPKADTLARSDFSSPSWPTMEPATSAAAEASPPAVEISTPRPTAASWSPQSTLAVEKMERLAGPLREAEKAATPSAMPEATVAAEQVEVKPVIISEQAGRQVSAAFGELNDAYAARSRKSFDEIAAEMMRPMLQDWLDNNLPTLVERLVREEIERVARGAQ